MSRTYLIDKENEAIKIDMTLMAVQRNHDLYGYFSYNLK